MTETPGTREAVIELLADALNGGPRRLPMPGYVKDSETVLNALADAGLALRPAGYLPIEREALIEAVEGECDGLSIDTRQADAILDWIWGRAAADLLRDDDGEV
ncbi:MAG: hypothetical protein AAF719_01170 [Pseudomonadota bacterium]